MSFSDFSCKSVRFRSFLKVPIASIVCEIFLPHINSHSLVNDLNCMIPLHNTKQFHEFIFSGLRRLNTENRNWVLFSFFVTGLSETQVRCWGKRFTKGFKKLVGGRKWN